MSSDIFAALVKEVTAHVSDADLHLSHLVLDLLASIVTAQPATPGLAAVLGTAAASLPCSVAS